MARTQSLAELPPQFIRSWCNGDVTPTEKATQDLVPDRDETESDKPIEEHDKVRHQHGPTLTFLDRQEGHADECRGNQQSTGTKRQVRPGMQVEDAEVDGGYQYGHHVRPKLPVEARPQPN